MSISPTLSHRSVDQSLSGHTDKQYIADSSSNPTCTQCIYPLRILGGRSNSLYLSHTENLGLQRGCSHRTKKRNKEKISALPWKTNNKTKSIQKQQQEKKTTPTTQIFQVLTNSFYTAMNFHCPNVIFNYMARHLSLFNKGLAITLKTLKIILKTFVMLLFWTQFTYDW